VAEVDGPPNGAHILKAKREQGAKQWWIKLVPGSVSGIYYKYNTTPSDYWILGGNVDQVPKYANLWERRATSVMMVEHQSHLQVIKS